MPWLGCEAPRWGGGHVAVMCAGVGGVAPPPQRRPRDPPRPRAPQARGLCAELGADATNGTHGIGATGPQWCGCRRLGPLWGLGNVTRPPGLEREGTYGSPPSPNTHFPPITRSPIYIYTFFTLPATICRTP